MGDNIKVVVKVRPLISREIEEKLPYQWRVGNNTLYQIDSNKKDCGNIYTFDKVYDEGTKTCEVYNDIAKPIVEAATAGINGTIFAYGQTSSGKTYTMSGTEDSPGIIQLAVLNLFDIIKNVPGRDFLVRVSFIELYNEALKDLLDVNNKKEIKIHETFEGIKVDVKEKVTASPEEVLEAMKEGNNNRQTGATNMNEQSSRSHSIFQITIESREHTEGMSEASSVNVSQLNLVDLAGSERAGQTGATGKRFKEGTHINKSLSALALVIKQLSDDPKCKKHVNYRDNKLTRILQNSLGGNAKTCIICAVTPAALEETISTLQFATRAKTIQNKPEVNAVENDKSMIQKLTKELSRLQVQLRGKMNVEQHLQKRVDNLQKLILNGFNQRANEEMMGGIRNLQPRRRVTIHSTKAAGEEPPTVTANRFHTPMLKYNPLLVSQSADFIPIQSTKLAPLPEESLPITPPPTERNVCRKDDVIVLDSDDELGPNDLSCSPHHSKCRDLTKTPPCRLRKDAEENKRKVMDLEEFTTLEKIYGEDVAELKKKLEEKNSIILNLNEEIDTYKNNYQEKCGQIDILRTEVTKAREELISVVKLKEQLENQCEEYKTKLTDSEVSYETLQRKSKSREQELLSLLNEKNKQRAVEDFNKTPIRPAINFMDLSKDISLVNSDCENSFHDESINSSKSGGQSTDVQVQLNAKNQIIADLEQDITFLKCRIDGLEKSNSNLLSMGDEFKNTITTLETENDFLKSKVESLTTDLNSQIKVIQTAQSDMESYKSLIQELQIKLTTQENLLNIQLNDSELENMILHEKKAIATNENIANIIHVLKSTLGKRTKEIEELKASMHNNNESKIKILSDMKHKTEEIVKLNVELSQIKEQLEKNEDNLNKLRSEKDNNETLLTNKLHDVVQNNHLLEETNRLMNIQINDLAKECKELKQTITKKIIIESNNLKIKEDLECKLKEVSTNVEELEQIVHDKQYIIDELTKTNDNNNKYLEHAQITINKIKNLFLILTGEVKEIPELLEDFVSILNTMSESLTVLEDVCSNFVKEKDAASKTISLLKNESIQIKDTHKKEIKVLNDKIEILEEKITLSDLKIESLSSMSEEKLISAEKEKDHLIQNLAHNISVLKDKLDLDFSCEEISGESYKEDVLLMFEKIVSHIILDMTKKSDSCEKLQQLENENRELMKKLQIIQKDSEVLKSDLDISKELLEDLSKELSNKASEMIVIEEKAKEWKGQFQDLDKMMKRQMQELTSENEKLKLRMIETKHDTEVQINQLQNESNDEKLSQEVNKFVNTKEASTVERVKSPPSLLTICCDTIADTLDLKNNAISITPTSSNTDIPKVDNPITCRDCERLMSELQFMGQENDKLMKVIEQFKSYNNELLKEQEEVRKELKLLTEPAEELQKKIVNHKTSLGIFTATAYAENVLLKSQVAGLKHKHKRMKTLCQRDIPDYKIQLLKLMKLLKEDSDRENNTVSDNLPKLNANSTVQMNDSTLDDDMLMLDTNVTLTTVDNTVIGFADQTDLDLTQTMLSEISCQANNLDATETNYFDNNTSKNLSSINAKIESKKDEVTTNGEQNNQLYSHNVLCYKCKTLNEELSVLKSEKENLEVKYNKIVSDVPKTEELLRKLKQFDEDYNMKVIEITKLDRLLKNKTEETKVLQEENEALSTQLMENISEIDDLCKELEKLKIQNSDLVLKCEVLESSNALKVCPKCTDNESVSNIETHTKLSRRLSDSETTSTINKICTLQTELHAGQEDCKVLTEQVAIIKDHMNLSTMSMELDDSITDLSTVDKQPITTQKVNNMPDIKEEKSLDLYKADKTDCYNYYLEITGDTNKSLGDVKIIEVMKLFYNNLLTKHGNEVENLVNKLKDYKEAQIQLQTQIENLKHKLIKSNAETEQNVGYLNQIKNLFEKVKCNLEHAEKEIKSDSHETAFDILKDQVLGSLDVTLASNATFVLESLITKYQQKCLNENQNEIDRLSTEVNTAKIDLNAVKNQLLEKEKEYNLVNAHNEKMKEISGAVTLDLIQKEENANEHLKLCCIKLLDMKVISHDNINFKNTFTENLDLMVDHIINERKTHSKAIETVNLEINNLKTIIEDKEKELTELKLQNVALKDVNNNLFLELNDRDDKIQSLKTSYEELDKAYNSKIKENTNNLNIIDNLTEELCNLNETVAKKECEIESLYEKTDKTAELLKTIKNLQTEKDQLQIINQMITKEKDSYILNLEQSCETIKQNNIDMQKMTSDILTLRESLNEASATIKKLKSEAETLSKDNIDLKQIIEQKNLDWSRMKTNIKTHEKTAEIQNRMITKFKKLNEELNQQITERQSRITELSSKNSALTEECELLKNNLKAARDEVSQLQSIKESLESRIAELEEVRPRSRTSMDAMLDSSRRRRQSIQESRRMFEDEHKSLEAVFGARSSKPEDLFMDAEDNSGRSTPFTHSNSKGRESLLSQADRSDKDEDPPSRPSSVMAMNARKRRQSSHDLHRSVVRHTPSPHDLSNKIISEMDVSQSDFAANKEESSEITKLREQLSLCQQELEDLKIRYKEVDEECETCSQYLQERDEQCRRLKREKVALEQLVTELRAKQYSNAIENSQVKRSFADASVNTDEDWTKLHSLVVDRMSYDSEVEKNKRLTKIIEELRFKKQELKNTLSKMQKALDKNASKDTRELELTKEELNQCKEELKEWKLKFKEVDEECEICSEYLKQSEEQCKKLKEAKIALEAKLQELQEDAHSLAHTHSVKKRRQTIHDKNRSPVAEQSDAATETTEELSSYQEDSYRKTVDEAQAREVSQLKMTIETMYQQKRALEQQLRAMPVMPNPMYVATGSAIVQNQQITDVLKENQKLKQINAKLINICKKRGKSHSQNRENEDPCEQA